MSRGIIGAGSQCGMEVGNGLIHLPLLEQDEANAIVGADVVRLDFEGFLAMGERLVEPAVLVQEAAEVAFCQGVIGGAGQGASPERFAIAPKRGLRSRTCGQNRDAGGRAAGEDKTPVAPTLAQLHQRPGEQEANADLRQVGVTVRSRLTSDLNQAGHGHEHSEVPEPAGQEPRALASPIQGRSRDRNQYEQGQSDFPRRQTVDWVRVGESQICWINHLCQVRGG